MRFWRKKRKPVCDCVVCRPISDKTLGKFSVEKADRLAEIDNYVESLDILSPADFWFTCRGRTQRIGKHLYEMVLDEFN